jgi:hypothetical protein
MMCGRNRKAASCLPQSDRRRRFCSAGLVMTLVLAHGAAWGVDTPISANVASLFVGEQKVVEGKVQSADRDGSTVTLRFGGSRDLVVSLVIPLLNNFPPDPDRAYLGKTVRVVGTIRDFRGVPEMVIRDAGDIQIVGETSAAAMPAASAAAAPEPGLQRQVELLNERLRDVDERLRALEGSTPPAAGRQGGE